MRRVWRVCQQQEVGLQWWACARATRASSQTAYRFGGDAAVAAVVVAVVVAVSMVSKRHRLGRVGSSVGKTAAFAEPACALLQVAWLPGVWQRRLPGQSMPVLSAVHTGLQRICVPRHA